MSIDTKKLVLEVLSNLANDYDIDEFKTADENTKIYTGFGGKLDSLGYGKFGSRARRCFKLYAG